ncbi:hypothetical protein ACWELQ_43105, partial [Nocardia sp. NPDC004722]
MERLRRQLEATSARAAKRTPRAPRTSAPDQSHDLFGRDSTDPYTSSAGTWNYGPSTAPTSYSPPPEDNSAAHQRSTWHTTDDTTTSADQSPPRETTGSSRPNPPDASSGTDVESAPNPSRSQRRPPTGQRRAPGQWREEAPTAPGLGTP